jgi:regulator of replication initiation timing
MAYEITTDEVKKLIGDLMLETYALRRDNQRLTEQLQQVQPQSGNVTRMPEPRQALEREPNGG